MLAPVLTLFDRILGLFSIALVKGAEALIHLTSPIAKRMPFVTRDEFRYIIEESTKRGVLRQHERQMINTVLSLSSSKVNEGMIPLAKFPKVSLLSNIGDIKRLARTTKANAFLVYEEIPSLVVGMIYVFDVLFESNESLSLSKYLKAPLFIKDDTSSEKALFLLQSKRASYAAVINLDREVVGVVNVENLIHF